LAKALSAASKSDSKSALNGSNFSQIQQGGASSLPGGGSDSAGHKAGAKRHLSQQQWTQMAAQIEERGRLGFARFVDPKNNRRTGGANHAALVVNDGARAASSGPKASPPMSLDERIAQHDERWKFDPNLRHAVGIKIYGR
jgi:hypothetical protein